ncbi:MAG: hypothetical protein AAFV93_05695 [Chloroflexota bacterium]
MEKAKYVPQQLGHRPLVVAIRHLLWRLIKSPYYLLHYLLNGRVPEFETQREAEIFWRVKRRYRRKRLFLMHMLLHLMGLFISFYIVFASYLNWQEALSSGATFSSSYLRGLEQIYESNFATALIVMVVWTIVLIAHSAFNRIGNAEDKTVSEAFDTEYMLMRQEHRSTMPDVSRLEDNEDYQYRYNKDSKLRRNSAN